MEALLNAIIPSSPLVPLFHSVNQKPSKVPAVCCSRKIEDISGFFRETSQIELVGHDNAEVSQPQFQSSNEEPDVGHNDIWRLFREAQQNILYLNKQRLTAIEELKNTNREKQLLLGRIEQLEVEKQACVGKDKLSICWELLFRIDSMVLTGMITTGEASDFRRLIMDYKYSLPDVISDIMQKGDTELLAELRVIDSRKKNGFYIIHICTEMAPLVSVGSLASYVTGISLALQRKGHLVEVILPKCASLDLKEVQGLREIEAESYSYFNGQLHGNRIWTGVVYGIGVTLIQPLFYSFFNRERLYGYSDDFERFSYFSRASLDYILKMGKQPDVLHIHNWETAIVGPLFWDIFVKQGLGGTRILFTCHGFDSQCLEQPDKLALCGLDPTRLHRPDRLQDNTRTHLVNILKGGIVYSNKVVIMSSMHSKGRIIHSLNHGLEPTLAIHEDKFLVSPYGYDKSTWDPLTDKFLPKNFGAEDMKGKAVCKVALQQQLGLTKDASTILVGCIFLELTDIDLENLKSIVRNPSRSGVQFIFMEISRMPRVNRALESLQEELKGENVRFISKHDEALLHLIFAGSDIILCQSLHDPVLQVPLKALAYGAAPVAVTSNDKIFRHFVDPDYETNKFSQFSNSTFGKMTLTEALDEIMNNPSEWKKKMRDAMAKDFSWDAECYELLVSAYAALNKL